MATGQSEQLREGCSTRYSSTVEHSTEEHSSRPVRTETTAYKTSDTQTRTHIDIGNYAPSSSHACRPLEVTCGQCSHPRRFRPHLFTLAKLRYEMS